MAKYRRAPSTTPRTPSRLCARCRPPTPLPPSPRAWHTYHSHAHPPPRLPLSHAIYTSPLPRDGRHAASPHFDPKKHLKKVGLANQTTMYKKETQAIGKLFEKTMMLKYGMAGGFPKVATVSMAAAIASGTVSATATVSTAAAALMTAAALTTAAALRFATPRPRERQAALCRLRYHLRRHAGETGRSPGDERRGRRDAARFHSGGGRLGRHVRHSAIGRYA